MLELLAAVCLVRGGHDIILAAFDNFKEVRPQQGHPVPTWTSVLQLGLSLGFPACGRALHHPQTSGSLRDVPLTGFDVPLPPSVPRAMSQLGWVPGSTGQGWDGVTNRYLLSCHPPGCPLAMSSLVLSPLLAPRSAGRRTASRS